MMTDSQPMPIIKRLLSRLVRKPCEDRPHFPVDPDSRNEPDGDRDPAANIGALTYKDRAPNYRFSFIEHDSDGGAGTKRGEVVLCGVAESFVRAVVETLRNQPFISDVAVTVEQTTSRVLE